MTAVWTAMSLQRRDGSSNSLSRSLGSLMSPGNVDDYSTVMLHSNMVASSSASHSRWSVGDHLGEGTDLDIAQSRQVQTPLPKLQRILTDSASSIMFLGKRILREYQSVFVLPDKQQVFVRRNEVFMPEDAVSEVTLSMAVSAPSEVRSFSAEKQVRRRVQEFLENDDWKSAMLASSESRDAELLGYMNSRYSNSATRRSRLERSESRRRRQEIVKARELYSDDEEGEVQFSSDEELAEKPLTDPSLERRIISPPRTISPEPLLPDRVGRSAPILPQRAPHFRAPIIARSDTPGKRNVLESNEKTKKKFEEIRRRWDERIAMEQFHSQEQFEGAGGQSASSTSLYNEGHRGTAITSILPKTDRREKYAESAHTQNTRTLPPISPQSDHDLRSGPHYFLNRTNTLPDTHTKSDLPGLTRYGERQMVPSPTYSEPFTEREEKETRFSYSQTRLKVGQENFGQLGHNLESHSPTRLNKTYATLRTQSLDRSVESRVIYEAMHTIESIPFRLSATSRPRYSARLQPDSHQASMSLNVDQKPRLYMDSKFKQNYIYRTTLSRLPVTVRQFRARRHSAIETTESELTEGDHTIQLAERNFTLSRQPTLLIDWQSVRQKSRTLPPRLTTKATVCLKAPMTSSDNTSRKRYMRSESNQERLTIHITDQQETIVHGDFLAQSVSLRRRPASAEPRPTFEPPHVLSSTRARKALLVYPQPSGTFNWKSPLTGSVSPSLICTDQQEPQPGYKSDLGLPSVTTDEDFDAVSPTYSRLHRIDRDHDPYMPILSHRTHPSVPIPPTDHRTAQETDDQSTKDGSNRVGRKKHPPPPTSPPYHRPSRTSVEDPNDYLPVLQIEDPGAGDDGLFDFDDIPNAQDVHGRGARGPYVRDAIKGKGDPGFKRDTPSRNGMIAGHGHPDEYNLLDEAERRRHRAKEHETPSDVRAGMMKAGDDRKQPDPVDKSAKRRGDRKPNIDETTERKHRHPPPPKTSDRRREPQANGYDDRSGTTQDRRERKAQRGSEEPEYVNLPGRVTPGAQPWEEDTSRKPQELSDPSNEQSSYDPRVGDVEPAFPSGQVIMRRRSDGHSELDRQHPKASPRKSKPDPTRIVQPRPTNRGQVEDDEDDDEDDLDDSDDGQLKPPALRSIPQTKKSAESLVRAKHPVLPGIDHHRHPPHLKPPSPRGSLLSPGGMSAPSLPGYFPSGILAKHHRTGSHGPYRPEQFNPQQYAQHERSSRPRSKRDTATSDHQLVAGSKHSLIISTKRRTLSGVTGTNPIKTRSNSMNDMWFGDHPVPSSGAVSPNMPLRLSTIQLQAQAELERRQRSSSRTHSLDRRSGHSGVGTESRLSRAPTEIEGYEGVGYGYDTRGRLIHGGANLHERAASRKRRLRDGHESLSRVWIPQADNMATHHVTEASPGAATGLDDRKAHLDDSAVAFALRDFTSPGVR